MFWDFILCGIEAKHRSDMKTKEIELLSIDDDPLANLDYLCVAMIMNIKAELLESDFSMCFAILLNYPEPNVPEVLLRNAIKIKNKMKESPQQQVNGEFMDLSRQRTQNLPSNSTSLMGNTLLNTSQGSTSSSISYPITDDARYSLNNQEQQTFKENPYNQAKREAAEESKSKSKFPFLSPFMKGDLLGGGERKSIKTLPPQNDNKRISIGSSAGFVDPLRASATLSAVDDKKSKENLKAALRKLTNVDNFLEELWNKNGVDQRKLSITVTELRDAINMLNQN